MLKALVSLSRSKGLTPEPGFADKRVRWSLMFDKSTAGVVFAGLRALNMEVSKDGRSILCPRLSQSALSASTQNARKSHFIVEALSYVALVDSQNKQNYTLFADAKTISKHSFYVGLLRKAAVDTQNADLAAVAGLLDDPAILGLIMAEAQQREAASTDSAVIELNGSLLTSDESLKKWWIKERMAHEANQTLKVPMRCMVTGELVEPARVHLGLDSMGLDGKPVAFISMDKPSSWSYGMEQSANCAMSEATMRDYCAALAYLLNPANGKCQRIGHEKDRELILHWYMDSDNKEYVPDNDPLGFLQATSGDSGPDDAIEALLSSVRTGKYSPTVLGKKYHVLRLRPLQGRVAVRAWYTGSMSTLADNIKAWFDDLRIVRPTFMDTVKDKTGAVIRTPRYPRFSWVLNAAGRDTSKERTPSIMHGTVSALWDAAIDRYPFPVSSLGSVIAELRSAAINIAVGNRNLNGTDITRLGFLKASLIRSGKGEGLLDVVNEEHPSQAYQLGRLLSVASDLQRRAMERVVEKDLTSSFYSTLSSTPRTGFARFMRKVTVYLSLLDADHWYHKQVAGIVSKLKDIPPMWNLREQGEFTLGYYQQKFADINGRAAFFAAKKAESVNVGGQLLVSDCEEGEE